MKITFYILSSLAILFSLYVSSLYNYLLFHSIAEGFSIVIAFSSFMVVWNTRRFTNRHYLTLIGVAYLFVGMLDFIHLLSYEGMNIFTGFGPDIPTQLWISARYMESLTFLAIPMMLHRRVKPRYYFPIYAVVSVLLILSIFVWRNFPVCFASDTGLTAFKVASEYIICIFLVAAGALFIYRRMLFENGFLIWALPSIGATVVSELAFTQYASVFGFSNLVGHFLKIVSFYLIYKAVIETGLTKPHDLLFSDLSRQRERLRVILNSIADGVIATDAEGRVTFVNPLAEALTGWKSQEAVGQPIENVIQLMDVKTAKPLEDYFTSMLREHRTIPSDREIMVRKKGGDTFPIESRMALKRDAEGQVGGVVIIFRNITERKAAEQHTRHLASFPQLNPNPILEVSIDGAIVFRNEATSKVLEELELTDDDSVVFLPIDVGDILSDLDKKQGQHHYREVTIKDRIFGETIYLTPQFNVARIYAYDITYRKQVENILRADEARLRGFYESGLIGVIYWNMDGIITDANGKFLEMVGYSREELVAGRINWTRMTPEEFRHIDERAMIELETTGVNKEPFEKEFLRKDGTRISVIIACAMLDEARFDGVAFVLDNTERKKAEQKIVLLSRQLQLALDSAKLGWWQYDPATRIATWDDRFKAIFGVSEYLQPVDEILQKNIHQDDLTEFLTRVAASLEPDKPQPYTAQFRIIRPDGALRWIEAHGAATFGGEGKDRRAVDFVGTVADITAKKEIDRIEKRSKARQELLATVAERLLGAENPEAIVDELCRQVMAHIDCQVFFHYLVEIPGRRLKLNACAGISPEEADKRRHIDSGTTVCGCVTEKCHPFIAEDIQHKDDPIERQIKELGIHAFYCHPLTGSGEVIGTLSFGTSTRIRFTDDEVTLMKSVADQVSVAMQQMLTAKKLQEFNETLEQQVAVRTELAESRARQLQALAVELTEAEERERQRIAQLLHDDLQQILAAARMQIEVASNRLPENKNLATVEKLLLESISKSRHLSQELSPPVLYHADLAGALKWLIRQMKAQFGLQVEFIDDRFPSVKDNFLKVFIFRSVQELLFNVFKHAGKKKARLRLSSSGNNFNVIVSDHGRGFESDSLDITTASGGFGLLSLRERAGYIGGNLVIDSTPGKGSRLTLTVPLALNRSVQIAQMTSDVSQTGVPPGETSVTEMDDIRVLFVDDHKVMRQGLIQLVKSQPKIQVVGEAANGFEAIDQVRQLLPDVVVMDVNMPGMDGVEATRRIIAEWPNVHVIGLSMLENDEVIARMHMAGAKMFVSKTTSSTELLKAIYGVMQQQ